MRLRGLSSHSTLGLAVQILSSSFCGCNRQFYSLVPPMLVRCGLQPQLALALSGSFSSFRGPSSAELAVSRKVFLLQQMRWHDFWWVSSFWSALVEADTGSLHGIIFHDAIQLALAGCKFSWVAQVFQCFSALGEPLPLVADAPIAFDIDLLQELFLRDRLASFDSLPQDPRLAPLAGVKLCTYHRWFGRPQNAACPSYWESLMGNARLHRILRFRMGSHHLPVEEGRHFTLPRASRVCNLCNTGALGDERHMLLECPALAGLRLQFSSLLLPCSSVMRRLLWAKDQHEVCRYINSLP